MKILVCDDDNFALEIISAILEPYCTKVLTFQNGNDAIKTIKNNKDIDIIIMDVLMPGMSGYEAAKKIKTLDLKKHVPILFLTSLSSDESLTQCLDYGDDFITKPVSPDVILAKIRAHKRFIGLYNELQKKNNELTYYYQNTAYEREVARDIFESFMERNYLKSSNIRFHISPTSTFNGDLVLVTPSPVGGVYIMIGDITGHGLPAAIGTIPVTHTFFSMTQKGVEIGSISEELNKLLGEFMPPNMMCAATIMEINNAGNYVSIWSGGMNDGLVVSEKGNIVTKIKSAHMPLGALATEEFNSDISVLHLQENDRIYLYTDGVVECRNSQQEMLGEERLLAFIHQCQEQIFDEVINLVNNFVGADGHHDDDITIIEILARPFEDIKNHDNLNHPHEPCINMPFSLSTQLNSDQLKNVEPTPLFRKMFENLGSMGKHSDYLSTIISEMYNNALEHGVLQLDSAIKENDDGFVDYYCARQERLQNLEEGQIQIEFNYQPKGYGIINMAIEDSGNGFDYQTKMETSDGDSHGRGINIIDHFCEKREYSKEGRRLDITYELNDEKIY